jgi:stress-induced morphogen
MMQLLNNTVRNLSTIVAKLGPIQEAMQKKIEKHFGVRNYVNYQKSISMKFKYIIIYLKQYHLMHYEVKNVSWKHNVPKGSETHFEITIVSDKFDYSGPQGKGLNSKIAVGLTLNSQVIISK